MLGTLGALGPLRSFLGRAEQILIVNGDSLCRWPLRSLVRRHMRSGAVASLLVSKRIDPIPFGGGVGVAHLDPRQGLVPRGRGVEVRRRNDDQDGGDVHGPRIFDGSAVKLPAGGVNVTTRKGGLGIWRGLVD